MYQLERSKEAQTMEIHEKLDDLYRLHKASSSLTHGVREEGTGWIGFPPTKFVYAFFAFVNADVILTP